VIALDGIVAKLSGPGANRDHGEAALTPGAAVAAIVRASPTDGTVELFFIVRADRPDDPWSGHVAFPGGRRDPEDASLLATAIRETKEEVGIDLSPDELLARLPDVPAFSRSKKGTLVVTPFVFALRRDVTIVPNVEVATTLWAPLALLASDQGKDTFELAYEGKTYQMPFIGLGPDKHRLWGMTYRMLVTLLDALA
jgi:8-oxo-dGTP pyrophosphatase MutT (NUDIX family)